MNPAYGNNVTDAYEKAAGRGVLPSALSSAEMRDLWGKAVREAAIFSARTTSARYLQTLRKVIEELLQGRFNKATARLILGQTLDALGYTPEGGFPDAPGEVPPAVEHSLRDLRGDKRLDFIIRTQTALARAKGQKMRGMEPGAFRSYPAWELVRVSPREVPRGSTKSAGVGWQRRWMEVDGPLNAEGRLIAYKNDPVWERLGDASLFDDALDVDHPPFAYNSGMGWLSVSAGEVERLGIPAPAEAVATAPTPPRPKASTAGLDPDFVTALKRDLKAHEDEHGVLTVATILEGGGQ